MPHFWQSQAMHSWETHRMSSTATHRSCSWTVRSPQSSSGHPHQPAGFQAWNPCAPHCCCATNWLRWSTFGTTCGRCLPQADRCARSHPIGRHLSLIPSPWISRRYFRSLLTILLCAGCWTILRFWFHVLLFRLVVLPILLFWKLFWLPLLFL